MKCVYKIGRLFLIAPKLFDCFEPFQLNEIQYDDLKGIFYDSQFCPSPVPKSFNPNQNVLFLDFSSGMPDLSHGTKISTERDVTVWSVESNWVFSCNYGNGWLQISSSYNRATYYYGQPDVEGCTTTYSQPVLMAVECSLIMRGYLIVHAACIEAESKAVLFSAPSGVGKSTRANRWVEAYGAAFISGDRPIIDPVRCKALGAPWDGKERIYRNIESPIAAFNCIHRGEKTKLTRMSDDEKKRFLVTQTFIPMWDPMLVNKVFIGINQLILHANIWNLTCDQTLQAARECHDILFPKEPENILEFVEQLRAMDTPKSEYRVLINRFMDFKARKLGIPYSGTFELTPLCNLDCKMCYVHLHRQQMDKCSLLSTEHWKALIKDAHDCGMKTARLTGGECLTYPGFDDIFLYLQELGVDTNVLTNGLLLNDQRIHFFTENPARLIQVSIYGSSDDAYEKVTGIRCFETVYQNITNAKNAGLPVIIAITPNAFAYQDLPNILQMAEKSGIPYNINPILNKPRSNTGRDLHDLTDEQYIEIYRLKSEMRSEHLQPLESAEIQDPSISGSADIGIKCGAGRSGFAITWEGRMIPCLTLADLYSSPPVKDFHESWEAVNKWANVLPVPAECGSCLYQPQCIQCIGSHYSPEHPGHCNKNICRRMKKYAEAGLVRI